MSSDEQVQFQLSLSTADEEASLFNAVEAAEEYREPSCELPSGSYRIVDGELYRLIPGTPPADKPADLASVLRERVEITETLQVRAIEFADTETESLGENMAHSIGRLGIALNGLRAALDTLEQSISKDQPLADDGADQQSHTTK